MSRLWACQGSLTQGRQVLQLILWLHMQARANHRWMLKAHRLLQAAGETEPDLPCTAASPAHLAECFLHAQEISLLVEVAGSLSGDQHLEQVGHKPQEDAEKGLQAGDVSAILVAEASAASVGRQDGTR